MAIALLAASLSAMAIAIHAGFLPHRDPEASLAFYRDTLGFEVRSARPIIDVVQPDQLSWRWLATFVEGGRRRLVDLGYLSPSRAESIWQAFTNLQATPGARMITPGVLEIVAARR